MKLTRLRFRACAIVALGTMLGACGGEDDTADASGNHPPTISGSPTTDVDEDTAYAFVPSASDADGDPLTFSIEAQPGWATFDTTSGKLSGTPSSSNVGTHKSIVVSVSDGKTRTVLPPFDLTVKRRTAGNRAPTISGTPPTNAVVGAAYSFTPTASDPDNQTLTFTIRNRPAWASFDGATGRLQGTPLAASVGTFADIVISVSDGLVAVALPSFSIVVAPATVNRAPSISGTPMTSVEAGTPYTFVPTASDPDGNTLTFAISGRPSWAAFNTTTGRLSGTPPTGTTGTFGNIVIAVSDGAATASLPAFAITVRAPTGNRPPTISGTPSTTATQGTAYAFRPTASDPDGNALTFAIANRPTWATFSAATGALQGTPGATHVGTYGNIVISVSDGNASTPLPAFSITVASSNTPPRISGTPNAAVTQDTQYVFAPTASDADADTLTFSIANAPVWASFDTATGRLSGTPGALHLGTSSGIVISVSDGQASTSLAAFSITVQAVATGSATLSWTPPTTNTDGSPLTNLAGYKVYWSTSQGSYPNSVTVMNPGLTSYVVENLAPGTYFFVATALNGSGVESTFSTSASKTVQ
jgi:hypothetical protein